jgi:integrase
MFSIKILLRLEKINRKGEAPIYFRYIIKRKVKLISSGIYVNPKNWDSKKSIVKSDVTNYEEINQYLKLKENEISNKIVTTNNNLNNKIRRDLFDKETIDVYKFTEEIIKKYKIQQKKYYKDYERLISVLKAFHSKKNLYFNEIDYNFLKKFELYLKNEMGQSNNTIYMYFAKVKSIFKNAEYEKIVLHKNNPTINYKIKKTTTERNFLNDDELKKIIELELNNQEDISRDLFVFCCFCGGIRFSDLLSLEGRNYDGSHITFIAEKTKKQQRIKVPQIAIKIINKYNKEKIEYNRKLFPIFEKIQIKKKINLLVNQNLKSICQKAGIKKHISFHCSRHTFATRALSKGIGIEKVSTILGHSSLNTTQIYARIMNSDIDKAMDMFC